MDSMIGFLIQFLILLLVLLIVFWIVKLVAAQFGAPPIVVQICGLILLLILILALLNMAGALPGARWRLYP